MLRNFSIPKFKLPPFVAALGNKLPQWPHTLALTAALNAAIKTGRLAQESLNLLEGRSFLIDVTDTGGRAYFTYRSGLFRPAWSPLSAPDLTFRASLASFLQLIARQEDPDTLFFNRELCIEGDTELGLILKNMLDAVEWPKMPGFCR